MGQPVRDFLAATAARQPTPGGGSVAGLAGALGTALGEMAVAFSTGKKRFADRKAFHENLARRLRRARAMFQVLIADDIAAFGMYEQARGLPDGPEAEKARALATAAAIDVPRQMTKLALAVMDDLVQLADCCTRHLLTDLLGGAVLAAAVVEMSHLNVRINAANADDAELAEVLQGSAIDLARAEEILLALRKAIDAQLA